MYIRFFDSNRMPFRSFHFQELILKDYAVKIIDSNGIAHQVQYKEFSYFIVINK